MNQLATTREQFQLSTAQLSEEMSEFRPDEQMMSVAQHVAHAAQVLDWLIQGACRPEGFDLDFEPQIARVMRVSSLHAAREWFDQSITNAMQVISGEDDSALMEALPEGQIMGGMPRLAVVTAISEHTSHHRGALAVYSRLKGVTPSSPYGL